MVWNSTATTPGAYTTRSIIVGLSLALLTLPSANLSNTIAGSDELKDKIGEDDATVLMTTVEEALAWLEANAETATTEDLEAKQKVTDIADVIYWSSICVGRVLLGS